MCVVGEGREPCVVGGMHGRVHARRGRGGVHGRRDGGHFDIFDIIFRFYNHERISFSGNNILFYFVNLKGN